MGIAQSGGVNKAYFTFYEFSGELSAVDPQNEYNYYSMGREEAFVLNDLSDFDNDPDPATVTVLENFAILLEGTEQDPVRMGIITVAASRGKSDDSGCNAGFGMIALLLAGFLTRKFRKA